MNFALIALALGALLGVVAGGRPSNIGRHTVRAPGALGAALVCQAVPRLLEVSPTSGLACVLGSYALLGAFVLVNVRLVGMPVVLLGLALNVAVITVNGGMPVRADAVLAADRDRRPSELASLEFDAKRHLETPADRLTVLGDTLPVAPLHQVLSFGDLILAAGITNVTFRLLKPRAALRRRPRRSVDEVLGMLPMGGTVATTRLG